MCSYTFLLAEKIGVFYFWKFSWPGASFLCWLPGNLFSTVPPPSYSQAHYTPLTIYFHYWTDYTHRHKIMLIKEPVLLTVLSLACKHDLQYHHCQYMFQHMIMWNGLTCCILLFGYEKERTSKSGLDFREAIISITECNVRLALSINKG